MGTARLCVTVTGRTMAELRKRRDAVTDADLVELRLDTTSDPDAAAALAERRTPVIITCRPQWEGGHYQGSEEERKRLLLQAQELGAEFVDVEWRAGFDELLSARGGRGVVLSMHEFSGVPGDLPARADAMAAAGAEIIKIAVMANCLSDCAGLLDFRRRMQAPMALVAMGDAGLVTRVLAARFGSCWSYAGDHVAPGQITPDRLTNEFSFRQHGPATALFGVVGRPVTHSLSPAMHNAAFRALASDAVYLPLAAADYDDFLRFADAFALAGASVTAPFKVTAYERADRRDEISTRVHASNTVRRLESTWEACNTDVAGFLAPLERDRVDLRSRRATVLGAGGAARAVVHALTSAGAQVAVAARRREQALELARAMDCAVTDWPPPAGSWDVLVNTTTVGTVPASEDTPLPQAALSAGLVYDLVYNPSPTRLLRDAARAGCHTIGGLDMLIAQAERQCAWWTGRQPPAGVMRDAAVQALAAMSPIDDARQAPGERRA